MTDTSNNKFINEKEQLFNALNKNEIFSQLSVLQLNNLVEQMEITVIPGGSQLYQKGEQSNSMCIVICGCLVATRALEDNSIEKLAEIRAGAAVGEVGLILKQPRSADIYAIRDTYIANLTRSQFEHLLLLNPIALNQAIAKTIFQYSLLNKKLNTELSSATFAIIPLDKAVNMSIFCNELTNQLSLLGSVHHLTPPSGCTTDQNNIIATNTYSLLEQKYDYLIYQGNTSHPQWTQLAIRQVDHLILVTNSTSSPNKFEFSQTLLQHAQLALIKVSLVILHPSTSSQAYVNLNWHDQFNLERIYPIRISNKNDIARIARFITHRAIGVVLGGGGARGLAHIGVLKALKHYNIPIDMICGNSMGALIGAQYAHGTEIDELMAQTRNFVSKGERPTLPIFSLLSGRRVLRDLKLMFEDTQIESLWCPFFAISCNLTHANIKVHDKGLLYKAVLASNSPAGILPPVLDQGNLLVDAALLDNVPVAAMRKKIGCGTVIAIDVDVTEELNIKSDATELGGWKMIWHYLLTGNSHKLPNIIELLNRSGHLGGLAHREASKQLAEHYLQPPTSQFSLMAYSKGEKIIEESYQYALAYFKNTELTTMYINDKEIT